MNAQYDIAWTNNFFEVCRPKCCPLLLALKGLHQQRFEQLGPDNKRNVFKVMKLSVTREVVQKFEIH